MSLSGKKVRVIDKIAMFAMGIINNTPYVIGIASAQKIVDDFNVPSYLGIVLWANTVSGIFSRFLNSWLVSLKVSYLLLFGANLAMMLFGLLACAFARNLFWLECVGIFFIGFSSNLGESVVLCYMSHRRKEVLLKSWGSGTGMAGIAGAGYSFVIKFMHVDNFWSFIGVAPVTVIYGLVFYLIIVRSPEEDPEPAPVTEDESLNNQTYTVPTSASTELLVPAQKEERLSVWNCSYFGENWWYMFNCGAVYFLEYVMQGVFADCAVTTEEKKKYDYFFPLLNLCYQVGVFCSRSSLTLFKFPWVGVLTFCQCLFFCLWQCQALFHFMPIWAMCLSMVVVGLFGGCSYVNVFNLMMTNPRLSTMQKEIVVSYNSFFISLFIVFSTLYTFVAEMTFMKPYIPGDA